MSSGRVGLVKARLKERERLAVVKLNCLASYLMIAVILLLVMLRFVIVRAERLPNEVILLVRKLVLFVAEFTTYLPI